MGPDAGSSFSQQFVSYQRQSKQIVAQTTLQSRQQVVYVQPDPKFERSDTIDWGSSSSRYVYYPPAFRQKFVPDYYRRWELANQEIERYLVLDLPLPLELQQLKENRSKYGQRCLRKGLRSLDGEMLERPERDDQTEDKPCERAEAGSSKTQPAAEEKLFDREIEAPIVYRGELRRHSVGEIEAVQQAFIGEISRISEPEEESDQVFEHYGSGTINSQSATRVQHIEPAKAEVARTPVKASNRTVKVAHSGELCDDEFEGYYNVRGRSHGCCF